MTNHSPVRTRMAPSPTGELHVGSLSILLKDYAVARKNQGQFVLRIEDTDQERLVPGAVDRILSTIKAFGLDWDEGPEKGGSFGPYVQSQRLSIYQQQAQKLVETGKAYHCFCSKERLEELRNSAQARGEQPRYDRHCLNLSRDEISTKLASGQKSVIRLKVPHDQQIIFTDLIRGEISFNSTEVDDPVLLKSDGFPTYHLAVVVDDHLMEISHVIRGEEWISSTPKHILLYQAFGWSLPIFAHIPVYLNPDGKGKMSKRQGAVSAQSFLDRGYLPEALLNFLMILGWSPKDQREILTLEEFVNEFELEDLHGKSVAFDLQKLDWLNGIYIRKLGLEELLKRSTKFLPHDFPQNQASDIIKLVYERLARLEQIEELTDFFYRQIEIDQGLLLKKADSTLVGAQLETSLALLQPLETNDWNHQLLESILRQISEKNDWHIGQYFMMLRVAVTGKTVSPPLFETMTVLGKQLCLSRLSQALTKIGQ